MPDVLCAQAGGHGALVMRCRACAAAGLPLRLVLLLVHLARQPKANGATPHAGVRSTRDAMY